MKCKICTSPATFLFNKLLLNKHEVGYYQCARCGFVQTERPFWLEEAYTSAITSSDLGLLYRNIHLLPISSAIICKYFNPKGKFLDYGGGYGIFTRLMRDKGFDFYRQDLFCENIFAKNFDLTDVQGVSKFELVTAFEVFEHLVDPVEELNKLLRLSDNIFFSTVLIPNGAVPDADWWYIIPETGQHISLFSYKSLQYLAHQNNMFYYTNGIDLHLFTRKKISPIIFKLLTRNKIARLYNTLFNKNKSLLNKDYQDSLEETRGQVV